MEKIGLIPSNEKYEYPVEQMSLGVIKEGGVTSNKKRKQVTLSFILMLGELAPEEADKVIIPTSVLSKLLGE
ncbi:TPA: hypothetical protein MH620_09430 [Klebsiella pneumoniae]|nr:hypothetical protein [Klebsiella pneumoniae]